MNIYIILILVLAGVNLLAYFWLTVVAFKRSTIWGGAVLLFSPISAIVFSLTNWFNAGKAFLLYIISFLLFSGTVVYVWGQVGVGNMQQIAQRVQQGKLPPAKAYSLVLQALGHDGPADLFAEDNQTATTTANTGKPNPVPAAEPATKTASPSATSAEPVAAPMPATMEDVKETESATNSGNTAQSEDKKVATVVARKADAKKPTPGKSDDPVAQREKPVPDINHVQPDPLAQKKQKTEPKTTVISMSRVSRYIGHYFIITLKNGNQRRGLLRKVEASRLILDRKLYGGNLQYRLRKTEIRSLHMLRHPPEER